MKLDGNGQQPTAQKIDNVDSKMEHAIQAKTYGGNSYGTGRHT